MRWLLAFCLAAGASAQAAEQELKLGVFPRRNAVETTRMFTPMAEEIGARLGRKVNLATSRNFDSFWRGVRESRYDIVHYNQYHYIRSSDAYQVVAHIEEGGKSTIAGAIFVRKDSGIKHLRDLRGRTVLFGGGEDAMVAYIATRFILLQAGLKKDEFKSLFAVNPPNAMFALQGGQADAAGAGDRALELPVVRKTVNTQDLVMLGVSPQFLHLPIAVKSSMPASERAAIEAALLELPQSERGRQALAFAAITGIGRARDKDYEPHRRMVQAVMRSDGTAK
ncbi:MAG TPA: PhnD/SsuA/transferrin family substrate-binding protein [Burkholderiales bacterium]|nr:PhnD/SsuA/transferrin family substrate-binding protein [Burkholderiales bacterium]